MNIYFTLLIFELFESWVCVRPDAGLVIRQTLDYMPHVFQV